MSIYFLRNTSKKCLNHLIAFNRRTLSLKYDNNDKNGIGFIRKNKLKFLLSGLIGSGIFYDGFINDFEYSGAAIRFLRSLKITILISLDYQWTLYGLEEGMEQYDKIVKEVNLRSAERILKGCLQNGGLYIKIGQGVSMINHVLPKEFTDTLRKLENECLTRKTDEVNKLFLQDFGKLPTEIFAEFDERPLAAASLAQVFKATTKSGEFVAVKVQYIDLQKRFSGDFSTIIFLQSLIKLIHKKYNFEWVLKSVRKNLEQELNFINEGKNAEKCANDLAKFNYVYIPKVYWDLTNTRVLTAEWIDGYKVTDLDNIKKDKFNIADINKKLFNIFSEQIFNTGFIHADPHPGNIFLRKTNKGKLQIILLDHGLYEHLPDNIRLSLCKFWEAIVLKDADKMNKYANELQVNDSEKLAEILLQRPFKLKSVTAKFQTTKLTDDDIAYMQHMAKQNFDIVLDVLQQLPKNMLFVIRNLNTVRAIARNHGDPIDRPMYMAKYAQKCIYKNDKIVFRHFKWFLKFIQFEYAILKNNLQIWLLHCYLNILIRLGRSPDSINNLLNYSNNRIDE